MNPSRSRQNTKPNPGIKMWEKSINKTIRSITKEQKEMDKKQKEASFSKENTNMVLEALAMLLCIILVLYTHKAVDQGLTTTNIVVIIILVAIPFSLAILAKKNKSYLKIETGVRK